MITTAITALTLLTLAPTQFRGEALGLPWWGWALIVISAFLLFTFILILVLDIRSTPNRESENE